MSREFNGFVIRSVGNNCFTLNQADKIRELEVPKTAEQFVSTRAKCQYIGVCTRPDVAAQVQLLASAAMDPKKSHFATLKKVVERMKNTENVGLNSQMRVESPT